MSEQLTDLGQLIFFDRYAQKDHDKTKLGTDDLVVVCVDVETRQRELANIVEVGDTTAKVSLRNNGELIDLDLNQIDKPVETFSEAIGRIAHTVSSAEADTDKEHHWELQFKERLGSLELVPAGRIWAGAGVAQKLTPYNCFVIPGPSDSRHGIVEALDRMTEIMSRGGGVGLPLMALRPKYAYVKGVNGRSSGSVCWSELYSFTTGLIEQGGSRRGALMLVQYCWHPDVLEFIEAKVVEGRLSNANMSVGITDAFMRAVKEDEDWDLIFPDTTHPAYNEEWNGDIERWKARAYPVKIHKTIRARDMWEKIKQCAWTKGEPGLLFVDRYNNMSNSYYYEEGGIFCCNPCGEEGLPPWGVCNLGHLNLPRFLKKSEFVPAVIDYARLRDAIHVAVRFMDNVIDLAYAPYEEQTQQQAQERRIGLGTMGLAEMLIRMHIRYGCNPECLKVVNELYSFITNEAYLASCDLAAEKGPFPKYDAECLLQSGFIKGLSDEVRNAIREKGLRNVTLLTQAPTGTVGTMMNTSTGMEPYPKLEWSLTTRLGKHNERAVVLDEYLAANPGYAVDAEGRVSKEALPDYFVTAEGLTPDDHVQVQAAIQRWVDASISKTNNLPNHYTPEEVGEFYAKMYDLGCKGGTVYRVGSREEEVISEPEGEPSKPLSLRKIPEVAYPMMGSCVKTSVGKLSVKIGVDPTDWQPFEVWVDISKAGTILNADRESIARLISLLLRMASPLSPKERLRYVIDQLRGIAGGDSEGFGAKRVLSVPDGIARCLEELLSALPLMDHSAFSVPPPSNGKADSTAFDLCPDCHQWTLYRAEGCAKCLRCPYSKC